MLHTKEEIILASGSETRRSMLENLGVDFKVIKSGIDEGSLKSECKGMKPVELGLFLAKEKAKSVSDQYPDAYVIGADQICECDGEIFDKPGTMENCIKCLKALSGKQHRQNCCTCIFKNGELVWQHSASAKLRMRDLSDGEIRAYVELEQPLDSAGSYMLEKHAKHLFAEIDGDHDVILGLPLVALLNQFYKLSLIELS